MFKSPYLLLVLCTCISCVTPNHRKQTVLPGNLNVDVPQAYSWEPSSSDEEAKNQFETSLEEIDMQRVQVWVDYFTGSPKNLERFQRFLQNGMKYRKTIEKIFEDHGLPKDLYYLGMIESGYYIKNRSRAAAVGPWQFMKATATKYGLIVNEFIDERFHIYKSTNAAAVYLRDLYHIFNDWRLALAAYNAGEYRVLNAIRNARTRDFNELLNMNVLAQETNDYIPKMMAAKILDEQREKFQLSADLPDKEMPTDLRKFALICPSDFQRIAAVAGPTMEDLTWLNPDIIKGHIPASSKRPIDLYLPESSWEKMHNSTPADYRVAAMFERQKKGFKDKVHKRKRGSTGTRKNKISSQESNKSHAHKYLAASKSHNTSTSKNKSAKKNKEKKIKRIFKIRPQVQVQVQGQGPKVEGVGVEDRNAKRSLHAIDQR